MSVYVSIAVTGPQKKTFAYSVPPATPKLYPGQRVLVPFGRSKKVGFHLGPTEPVKGVTIKDIIKPLDNGSCFPAELFKFCVWMADYYFANPADCLAAALPPTMKKKSAAQYFWSQSRPDYLPETVSGLFRPEARVSKASLQKICAADENLLAQLVGNGVIIERWLNDDFSQSKTIAGFKASSPEGWHQHFKSRQFKPGLFDGVRTRAELRSIGWSDYQIRKAVNENVLAPIREDDPATLLDFIKPRETPAGIELNNEQKAVLEKLNHSLGRGFQPMLLHGVTGSGKTIVYCHICREAIKNNTTALVLTPEIALSSTMLAYFRGFFGDTVAVIHSAMTEKERLESWRGTRQGRYKIVVGPRSAVFAPLPDLGIIIVDEEHDSSYKQDDPAPRFHGRDCAVMRAKINGIPVLLGSASPSLESYYHALSGRYQLLKLTKRPGTAALPTVRIVDMRKDRIHGDLPYISHQLKKEVASHLDGGTQVILYLNRRGHSPLLKCAGCGHVPRCPHCRVNLTYHKAGRKLSCHYCGYAVACYDSCSNCHGSDFLYQGVGTQKVEENIPRLFDGAIPARLDSDSASGRRKAYQILTDFSQKKSNLLLGTQMVTKGLDLPDVTLVGVLSADMSLDLPDFRASEKAFARLLQVAGRSGRAHAGGEVIIQTFYPEHDVINDAARQDYQSFYEREIDSRQKLAYPPFSRMVGFVLSSKNEKKLETEALSFAARLRQKAASAALKLRLLGPAPCPLYYLRGRYRRHLFVKTRQIVGFVRMLTAWENDQPRFKLPSSIKLVVDVDPDDMM